MTPIGGPIPASVVAQLQRAADADGGTVVGHAQQDVSGREASPDQISGGCIGISSDGSSTYESQTACSDPTAIGTTSSLYVQDPVSLYWNYRTSAVSSCGPACNYDTAFDYYSYISGLYYRIIGEHSCANCVPIVFYSYDTFSR